MDQATPAMRRAVPLAERPASVCRIDPAGRGQSPGGQDGRQLPRPVAVESQPGVELRVAHCLLGLAGRRACPVAWMSSTNQTAVYGPVRTVVWEGSGREAAPYPDLAVRPGGWQPRA